MIEITGGELFARGLQAEGIESLFGLPSPEVDPLPTASPSVIPEFLSAMAALSAASSRERRHGEETHPRSWRGRSSAGKAGLDYVWSGCARWRVAGMARRGEGCAHL